KRQPCEKPSVASSCCLILLPIEIGRRPCVVVNTKLLCEKCGSGRRIDSMADDSGTNEGSPPSYGRPRTIGISKVFAKWWPALDCVLDRGGVPYISSCSGKRVGTDVGMVAKIGNTLVFSNS